MTVQKFIGPLCTLSVCEFLQKGAGAHLGGVAQDLRGWALFDDPAMIHEDDAIRDLAGKLDLMGDDNHGMAFLGELAHDLEHLADELGIEGGGRFVEQHELGLHRKHTGDGNALLAARQPLGIFGELVAEADFLEQPAAALIGLLGALFQNLSRRYRDILQRGQMRERLNRWKTKPISRRSLASSRSLRCTVLPLTSFSPISTSSM